MGLGNNIDCTSSPLAVENPKIENRKECGMVCQGEGGYSNENTGALTRCDTGQHSTLIKF